MRCRRHHRRLVLPPHRRRLFPPRPPSLQLKARCKRTPPASLSLITGRSPAGWFRRLGFHCRMLWRRFVAELKADWPLLKPRLWVIIPCLVFQYIHAIFTGMACEQAASSRQPRSSGADSAPPAPRLLCMPPLPHELLPCGAALPLHPTVGCNRASVDRQTACTVAAAAASCDVSCLHPPPPPPLHPPPTHLHPPPLPRCLC